VRVTQITVAAVLPTAQYQNIQPSITVEVDDGNVESATNEALRRIEEISAQYSEAGKALPQLHATSQEDMVFKHQNTEVLASYVTGGTANFDKVAHVYTNQFGQKFLSGSEFAGMFVEEFNADYIIPKMEAKYLVAGSDIKDMWALNAAASCSVGDAIHQGMELYGKYRTIGEAIDAGKPEKEQKFSHLHKNPIIGQAVAQFFSQPAHANEEAFYEAFVVSNDAMLCGSIDRLKIINLTNKVCRVQDWKTNTDIQKKGSPKFLKAPFNSTLNIKINEYWLQLSFYAHILKLAGWTVEGLDIFHYNGQTWDEYSHDVIDISAAPVLQTIKQQ
jgi:hypothetical protein